MQITHAETALAAAFPAELRALYRTSNGLYHTGGQWFVLWPLTAIIERNQQEWSTEDAAREKLVGFGDNGCGEPFCVPIDGRSGVYIWYPIEAAAYYLADSLPPLLARLGHRHHQHLTSQAHPAVPTPQGRPVS